MKKHTRIRIFCLLLLVIFLPPVLAQQHANLIPDASFETPTPAWFNENSSTNYYLSKSQIPGAPEGKQVLELKAWNETGTKVLSPELNIPAGAVTLTVSVRALNPTAGSKIAVALLDETGKKEIAQFVEIALNEATAWKVLSGTVTAPGGKVLLALLPDGPSNGATIQLDKLGLFPGTSAGDITNNADWQMIEAESLATNDKSWRIRPHFGWYAGLPSGGSMLTGSGGVTDADNLPATTSFTIKNAGAHILWLRLLFVRPIDTGDFSISILQNGQTVSQRTIASNDAMLAANAKPLSWIWVPIKVDLMPGTATVQFTRPAARTTWLARNIDLLLMTNLVNYQPEEAILYPQIYVRWTNTGSGDPYCLWTFVHRNRAPYYANAGMLGATGFSKSFFVTPDQKKWVGPGQNTPWSNLSQFLSDRGNWVQIVATRKMHTDGFVQGVIKGKLEFALGPQKKIIRTVKFDQNAPRIQLLIPGDLSKPGAKIETGYDALQAERAALPTSNHTRKLAKHLDLVTFLMLQRGMDDPAIIDGEFQQLANLGFNGTYYVNADKAYPETTKNFYQKYGMQSHFGLSSGTWYMSKNGDLTQHDVTKIDQRYQKIAEENALILPDVVRMKLADEPGAPSYEVLTKSDSAQQQFRNFLRQQKVLLTDLNVTSWDQVKTVSEKEKEANPVLFYYSGLFRLQVLADVAKNRVLEKKKYFPENVKTYVNYSPPFSWTALGTDPFLIQRNGGLEMGWSEDWLGYNASPEYTADTYALLRAAGQGQPLGGYMVAVSGGPLLQRIKYYTMVAGGARQISVYNYGPAYTGVDSWSPIYAVYPVLHDVQFELGNIDGALHGTKRRSVKIAILYNRTAAIWSSHDSSAEQDARYIRWALAHAGYDADIIPEEDIVAGKLEQYKVLYIDGIQLRQDAARKITAWVQNGGILFGGAGAATRDEFNRPSRILESTFGAKSKNLKMVSAAGRPKYELRSQKVLDTLQSTDQQHPVQLDQLCYSETLLPSSSAKVLFKDADGVAMGTQSTFGKGTAFRVAALPGLAYLNHAIRDKNYDPNTYLPQGFDPALRDFLCLPVRLAKVQAVAQSNLDASEITRYDAPGRSVLFVINYAGNKKADFSMLVPDASWATKAHCADGAKVLLSKAENGMTRITFPLNVAGAVVLEK